MVVSLLRLFNRNGNELTDLMGTEGSTETTERFVLLTGMDGKVDRGEYRGLDRK